MLNTIVFISAIFIVDLNHKILIVHCIRLHESFRNHKKYVWLNIQKFAQNEL